MDLSNLDVTPASEAGKFVALHDPAGRPIKGKDGGKVGFWVRGANSADYKRRERAMNQKRQENTQWKRGKPRIDIDAVVEDQRELTASAVFKCNGIVVDGKEWPEQPATADVVALFKRFAWIELQVSEFIADDANWLGEGSTS